MSHEYVIRCWHAMYGNQWLVIRVSDRRIVMSAPSVYTCLKWVKSWGDTDFAIARTGRELSSRCTI